MSEPSMPDFSLPNLTSDDLSLFGFDMPDENVPDPALPDLLQPEIPAELDLLSQHGPLSIPPDNVQSIALPQPDGFERLGELANTALSLALTSPDNIHLPSSLAYNALETSDGLSRRNRHLGMLLLGLEGKMEGVKDGEDSDAANSH